MPDWTIHFVCEGKPQPRGSKNPVVPMYGENTPQAGEYVRRHRAGCPGKSIDRYVDCKCPPWINVVDDNPLSDGWMQALGYRAREAYRGPALEGALELVCVFYVPRPKSHFGTGRNAKILKDSAPAYPTSRNLGDWDKLARAVGDALTQAKVIADDKLVVTPMPLKRWGDRFYTEVFCREAQHQTVADLVAAGVEDVGSPFETFQQLSLVG
jgi:Holliday junction resolvase RusA-like endonuclease